MIVAGSLPAPPAAASYDLTNWTLGRLVTAKKPAGIAVLGELPHDAAGKVLKHGLRARYGDSAQNGGSSE